MSMENMIPKELLRQYAIADSWRVRCPNPDSDESWAEQAKYGNALCELGYLVTSGPRHAGENEKVDCRCPRKKFEATNFRKGKEPIAVNEYGERIESSYK